MQFYDLVSKGYGNLEVCVMNNINLCFYLIFLIPVLFIISIDGC